MLFITMDVYDNFKFSQFLKLISPVHINLKHLIDS